MPTPNSHPHDPALAPDGALWYTGQQSNTLGRLDPMTGKVQEFHLKTPNSGPHGLVADRAGNIWFTANSKGYNAEAEIACKPGPTPEPAWHTRSQHETSAAGVARNSQPK